MRKSEDGIHLLKLMAHGEEVIRARRYSGRMNCLPGLQHDLNREQRRENK